MRKYTQYLASWVIVFVLVGGVFSPEIIAVGDGESPRIELGMCKPRPGEIVEWDRQEIMIVVRDLPYVGASGVNKDTIEVFALLPGRAEWVDITGELSFSGAPDLLYMYWQPADSLKSDTNFTCVIWVFGEDFAGNTIPELDNSYEFIVRSADTFPPSRPRGVQVSF